MHGVHSSDLCEEFHEDVLGDGRVEITDVACGFLVAMLDVGKGGHGVDDVGLLPQHDVVAEASARKIMGELIFGEHVRSFRTISTLEHIAYSPT